MDNQFTEKQRIERDTFNRIVKEKTQGKSLVVSKHQPSFADYNGDVFFGAVASMHVVGKRVLEIGCGSGEIATWFALHGARSVVGVDISEESIRIAQERKHVNGLGENVMFIACAGESVPKPDASFDIIFINVALHHLELEHAIHEFLRLLSPGGALVAIEPLARSPIIQKIRESAAVQKFYPIRRETITEKILTMDDVAFIAHAFGNITLKPYRIFSPFLFKAKPFFRALASLLFFAERDQELQKQRCNRLLQTIDETILRAFPFLGIASRYSVITARKGEQAVRE